MKTYLKIIALLCLICLGITASAQCPTGDVILVSQEEVNEFGTLYPDCTELGGDLQIGNDFDGAAADIIDLTSLNNITFIAGDLLIADINPSINLAGLSGLNTIEGDFISIETISLVGLENLTTIGGWLDVNVESFQGLNGLTTIGNRFLVSENNPVQNFIGLESLTSIGNDLHLDENCCINSFAGLENLSHIEENLRVDSECNCINSFSGLESLTTIEGNLQIGGVTALDFTGLDNLSTIGGSIHLYRSGMSSLSGLENVTVFGNNPTPWTFTNPGQVILENNSSLIDISAISNIPISNLRLQNNENLSVCNIESICEYFAQGGTGMTENNAEGCNSVNEIVQSCGFECPPTVVLLSQADVDEFGALYPNCTSIEGSLQIGTGRLASIPPTDINDLSPLNNITFIGVDLFLGKNDTLMTLAGLSNIDSIGNNLIHHDRSTLTSFEGLENLVLIGGNFQVGDFITITNFAGLNNLNSIEGDFLVEGGGFASFVGLENLTTIKGDFYLAEINPVNFQGLNNLSSIGGSLAIDEDNEIKNFIGLESLTSIGGNFYIDEDNEINTFSGLNNLNYIGGNFDMWINFSLNNFVGLENLNTIEGNIDIYGIEAPDFSGLDNLFTVGGGIQLWNCDMNSLNGLESITNFGNSPATPVGSSIIPGAIKLWGNNTLTDISAISHLTIDTLILVGNDSLAVCGIESICEYLAQGGAATIENNAEGCNTVEEVIQFCTLEYVIEGNVYLDANTDCLQDTSETGLDNWLIKIEEDNQLPRYAYTFGDGNYIALADSGAQYTITAIPPNMLWDNICPTSEIVSISADNPHDGVNFGANGSTLCSLLEVDVTAPLVRRCFDSNYYVRYCNSGTAIAENAYVEVQLDPFFTYQNSTIEGINLGENLYSFDLGNIEIAECGNFRIDVYVDCDSTVLGQTHCVEAHIFPDSICVPALPLWDESSIIVDAQCLGDSIEFKIENIGTGDMSDSLEYIVVEEDLIYQRANFQLNSGENKTFYKTANGAFHRLEAEQSPGHPGNSMPSVFVEGCSENDNGEISVGFVNYYLLDEGDAFVSIDCQENVGSYDPNDKQAFPVGYGAPHYITDSTDLEYLIRFQNTGTDTAFNIVIRDVIDPHLNIETLRPGVSSHPYRYDIEGPNTAVFHFENIMLPDSNVNEVASHGFIKFNIQQKENNSISTHIMNEADIYFDFNEPIITNTVFHTVGEDFRGIVTSIITPPEVSEAGVSVNVFPNPFDEYARFEVQGETVKELHLNVYDMMGREVLQQKAQHQQHITMKRNNLTPGVYVFRLMDEKQQLATGKLIIQ